MSDVFISYSRQDRDFARRLHGAIEADGREVWIDWQNIEPTLNWWQEIKQGIEEADTFVFVLSPDSVASKVCRDEIEHSLRHNKRLVPIVYREGFELDQTTNDAHRALGSHNWLLFRAADDFERSFAELVRAIETDFMHVKVHTRLLNRALEWERQGRRDSFLLRGEDLSAAEQWLADAVSKQPQATDEHHNYIETSREEETAQSTRDRLLVEAREVAEQQLVVAQEEADAKLDAATRQANRRNRRSLIGAGLAIVGLAVAVPSSIYAKNEASDAKNEAREAAADKQKADKQKAELAKESEKLNQNLQKTKAKEDEAQKKALLAQQQYRQAQKQQQAAASQAKHALRQSQAAQQQAQLSRQRSQAASRELAQVNQEKQVAIVAKRSAEQAQAQAAKQLKSSQQQRQQAQAQANEAKLAQAEAQTARDIARQVTTLEQRGNRLLRADNHGTSDKLVSALELAHEVKGLLHKGAAWGKTMATPMLALRFLVNSTVQKAEFQGDLDGFRSATDRRWFSPDSQYIVTYDSKNKLSRLYDLNGDQKAQFEGTFKFFSPSSQYIFIYDSENDLIRWYDLNGNQESQLPRDYYVLFSPDNQHIVSYGSDQRLSHLSDLNGNRKTAFEGVIESFSPNGKYVITRVYRRSSGSILRLYDLNGNKLNEFEGKFGDFSPDSQHVLTITDKTDETIRVYNLSNNSPIAQFPGATAGFSASGQYVVTGYNRMIQLYNLRGVLSAEFPGRYAQFSADGKHLLINDDLSAYGDRVKSKDELERDVPVQSNDRRTARLYDISREVLAQSRGRKLAEFQGDQARYTQDSKRVLTVNNSLVRSYDFNGDILSEYQGKFRAFSPDNQYVVTNFGDVNLLYDSDGNKLAEYRGQFVGFSPDSSHLLIKDGLIRLHYLNAHKLEISFRNRTAFSAKPKYVFAQNSYLFAQNSSTSWLYNLNGKKLFKVKGINASISPNGKHIMTYGDKKMRFYDASGQSVVRFRERLSSNIPNNNPIWLRSQINHQYSWQIIKPVGTRSRFTRDGNHLLIFGDRISRVYKVYPEKISPMFDAYGDLVDFSPDGNLFLTYTDHLTRSSLYSFSGNKLGILPGSFPQFSPDSNHVLTEVSTLEGQMSWLYDRAGRYLVGFEGSSAQFSPDGKYLLTSKEEKSWLYNISGERLVEFTGKSPQFSADGKYVLTSKGKKHWLHNLSGKRLAEFTGTSPQFSPSHKLMLITVPDENRTRLYNFEGKLLAEYLGFTDVENKNILFLGTTKFDMRSLGFSQDGTKIITLTGDEKLLIWPVDDGLTDDYGITDLINRGCAKLKNFRHRQDVLKVCPEK
ncbi:TIR domain-containing protein [filamentous cyanobacterium LEGE 11480]|uniref:TIR domain-containing protein n=1 Tax=Romeriopsis navalis LEGE 11480 TaxID=2777977 RepID=A0A928Z1V1_9CYAN|nr:TIR domain-containing protein [Romeriopsis navalis]MBE9028397.1 TIR domain-containing protein [Romeriopsis navalis LEGE 11480]